jgi:hypothetical protein
MEAASRKAFHEIATNITDEIIASIVRDVRSVYSTISLTKKPVDEHSGQMPAETLSLEMLQYKCRYLNQRYKWIIKQIE